MVKKCTFKEALPHPDWPLQPSSLSGLLLQRQEAWLALLPGKTRSSDKFLFEVSHSYTHTYTQFTMLCFCSRNPLFWSDWTLKLSVEVPPQRDCTHKSGHAQTNGQITITCKYSHFWVHHNLLHLLFSFHLLEVTPKQWQNVRYFCAWVLEFHGSMWGHYHLNVWGQCTKISNALLVDLFLWEWYPGTNCLQSNSVQIQQVRLWSKAETIVSLTTERDILVKQSGTVIEECSVCALAPCISSSPTGLWAPSCCWPWLPVCSSCSRQTDSSASKLPLNLVMFSPSARRLKIAASCRGDLQMWLSWMLRTWCRGFSYKVIIVGTGSHISQCSVKPNISWEECRVYRNLPAQTCHPSTLWKEMEASSENLPPAGTHPSCLRLCQ